MKIDTDIDLKESIYHTYHNYLCRHTISNIYDELSDEFLDPIMGCVIDIPYELPNSKMIIDAVVILSHLIQYDNQYDPYSRQPLDTQTLLNYNKQTDVSLRCREFIDRREQWLINNKTLSVKNCIIRCVSFSIQQYHYDTRTGFIYI
jgi:hypothetical protein